MYSSKDLSHLGLVAGMCDQLGIVDVIDQFIPSPSDQQKVSTGLCVKALILNGLGFVERRLYLTSQFFEDKPIAHLLGEGIDSSMLNDDRLGRCLDALYNFGTSALFSLISSKACQVLGIGQSGRIYKHLDTSSFHLDGVYNSESDPIDGCLQLTQGYSRDHRPDLNQVVLSLVCEHSAGIPLMMEALSGNSSDKTTFRETIANHIASFDRTADCHPDRSFPQTCWVADSALYSEATLGSISDQCYWLTRVPETLQQAKQVLASIPTSQMQPFAEADLASYRYAKVDSTYGGVKQEWLVVFSQEGYRREIERLEKHFCQQSLKEAQAYQKWSKQIFTCQADAYKALAQWKAQCKYIQLTDEQILTVKGYGKKGRPANNAVAQLVGYQIQASLSCSWQAYQKKSQTKGKFILATNQVSTAWSESEKLKAYKGQSKVEKGFRFLKDRQFLASTFFVKKPQRVEAILMIMTLSLLVYAALEAQLRKTLKQEEQTLPNQLGKPIENPTMKWIFHLFRGIHCLSIETKEELILLNINSLHLKIISFFGMHIKKYYQLE
jgi:transposase